MVSSSLGHSLVRCPLKRKVVSHLIPFMLAGIRAQVHLCSELTSTFPSMGP